MQLYSEALLRRRGSVIDRDKHVRQRRPHVAGTDLRSRRDHRRRRSIIDDDTRLRARPIPSTGQGTDSSSMRGVANAVSFACDAGPASELANSDRARWAASTKKVIDVEVIGKPINHWVKASDTQLGTAHPHRLARDVSPPHQREPKTLQKSAASRPDRHTSRHRFATLNLQRCSSCAVGECAELHGSDSQFNAMPSRCRERHGIRTAPTPQSK